VGDVAIRQRVVPKRAEDTHVLSFAARKLSRNFKPWMVVVSGVSALASASACETRHICQRCYLDDATQCASLGFAAGSGLAVRLGGLLRAGWCTSGGGGEGQGRAARRTKASRAPRPRRLPHRNPHSSILVHAPPTRQYHTALTVAFCRLGGRPSVSCPPPPGALRFAALSILLAMQSRRLRNR
jgi:hypothetical protein